KFSVPKSDKLTVKDISSATLQKDFLTLEEQEGSINFKFGIIYAKTGQTTDNEMLSNKAGSPCFNQFLDLLGDTIDLFGWAHYKGGLDTRNNATGSQSVYTVFGGHEVMFHVSTMLPYSEENKQQLERKRHIGNDIVTIIFIEDEGADTEGAQDQESDDRAYLSALSFTPSSITSHFNHIFALVTYCKSRDSYRLVLHSAESIPSFGPPLPPGGEFEDHSAFRDFLLAKLINGEKASYSISTFADKRERTLGLLMKDMEQKCGSVLRKSLSQLNITSPSNSKKYVELQQSFSEVGNRIKIEKIVSGNHPTSQMSTAVKKEPWETTLLLQSFPHKITCGDTC
ncbi:PREDICTED: GTPase-activating Rap/Ran-GAP domain-like protein 3, partial [Amphimedon queenslandica]|uniref:Rap-GAP domain-containing protein n=2 Tax=Amphimedon queenslandica TaxID=400682 RepID=A0AAN0K156_AMPQE